MPYFTDRDEFVGREPQHFGMVCLHGFRVLPNLAYWNKYGPYAIEMSPEWVYKNNFQKVRYIDGFGVRFQEMKRRFDLALSEVDSFVRATYPDDGFYQMVYTNKVVARMFRCNRWADFLTEFELTEPSYNSFENEWRHVRSDPVYNKPEFPGIVRKIENDDGWTREIFLLGFNATDCVRLHIPKKSTEELSERLPEEYSKLPMSKKLFSFFGL